MWAVYQIVNGKRYCPHNKKPSTLLASRTEFLNTFSNTDRVPTPIREYGTYLIE